MVWAVDFWQPKASSLIKQCGIAGRVGGENMFVLDVDLLHCTQGLRGAPEQRSVLDTAPPFPSATGSFRTSF